MSDCCAVLCYAIYAMLSYSISLFHTDDVRSTLEYGQYRKVPTLQDFSVFIWNLELASWCPIRLGKVRYSKVP